MRSLRFVMAALTILIFIVSLRLIFYHLVYLKNMKKSSLNLHNGQTPESILQFTDSNIALKEGKISMEFEYNQIKKIKEYKLAYVLMIGKKQGLILKKDSFSIGTFEEFKKFAKSIDDPLYYRFFMFLYYTGARKGEARAMTWKQIDFKNNLITISRSLERRKDKNGNYIINRPKNDHSRTIMLNSELRDVL